GRAILSGFETDSGGGNSSADRRESFVYRRDASKQERRIARDHGAEDRAKKAAARISRAQCKAAFRHRIPRGGALSGTGEDARENLCTEADSAPHRVRRHIEFSRVEHCRSYRSVFRWRSG